MTSALATQTLLPRDEQPTPAVHLSIPPLHRHRQQLHCPTQQCTLGNAATLSCDVPKPVHELHRLLAHVPACLNRKRHKPECSMIRNILPEPRPLGPVSPRRSPPSCLGSLSSVRLRRRMSNHDIHCRKLKPRQHRHDVAPALAFDHALLGGLGPVAKLRRRLAAAGRDDEAQGVCQVIVPHLGHLGYLLADHRMICFGSNACSAFARRGGHVSGNVVPQAVPHRDNKHVVAKCHAAGRDGGQEGPSGPSGRATEPGSAALPLGGVDVEAGQHVSMACVISIPPHEQLRPK